MQSPKLTAAKQASPFLVNPIKASTVAEVAVQHEVLPEKSTDFYPKLVSGLVMMDISTRPKTVRRKSAASALLYLYSLFIRYTIYP